MDSNLIAGYAAFTTSDEYCAASEDEAPATITPVAISIAAFAAGASSTYYTHC